MSFAYPFVFWLAVPLALFVWLYRPRRIRTLADATVALLLVGALANPTLPQAPQTQTLEAREILFALDISRSMKARDLPPNRYRFAKATMKAFLAHDTTDSIGLVAFTTNPLLLAPPTTDHRLVALALDALEPDNILTRGTSLMRLFDFLGTLEGKERIVVLITDGGEERDTAALAQRLPADTRLVILPTATAAGAPVPQSKRTMLKDKRGNLVISRRNPALAELASHTGAAWVEPESTPEATAEALHDALSAFAARPLSHETRSGASLAWLLLLPAALLFFVAHTRFVRYLIALAALAHLPLEASWLDTLQLKQAYNAYYRGDINASVAALRRVDTPSLQRAYLQAALQYRRGAYNKAARAFLAIRTASPRLKQRLLYNAATAYAKAGRYETAKRLYAKALQLGDDADTRHNLAAIALLRAAQAPEGRTKPGGAQSGASGGDAEATKTTRQRSDTSASQSGGGGNGRTKASVALSRKPDPDTSRPMPLSSKVYDLINKGYIRETRPW